MDLGIAGKRALVIGGTSGLGLASAEALAAEGVAMALFARDTDKIEAATAKITADHRVPAMGFAGDLTRQDDVKALATWARETGGIDILVLNTPRPPSPMRDFLAEDEDERWELAYRNQLESALFALRHLTPLLLDKGWGRLIAITSAGIKHVMPRHAVSTIFRAGVHMALKQLVDEVAPHGVTVNMIGPATVITPTFSQFHNLERRISEIPLKRAGKSEELGGTVAFLASQQAGFLTGQALQLDGGMTRSF